MIAEVANFSIGSAYRIKLLYPKLPRCKIKRVSCAHFSCYTLLVAAQQLSYSPLDRKIPQVRVMLTDSHKHNGHVGRVNQTD